MAIAIHKFFHERGFFYFHTSLLQLPIVKGAGQMFQVNNNESVRSGKRMKMDLSFMIMTFRQTG